MKNLNHSFSRWKIFAYKASKRNESLGNKKNIRLSWKIKKSSRSRKLNKSFFPVVPKEHKRSLNNSKIRNESRDSQMARELCGVSANCMCLYYTLNGLYQIILYFYKKQCFSNKLIGNDWYCDFRCFYNNSV